MAQRMAAGFGARGHEVRYSHLEDAALDDVDIIHALNAERVGLPLLQRGLNPASVVITWTGTDLWNPEPFSETDRALLAAAGGHTVLGRDAIPQVAHKVGIPGRDILLIPPGVDTGLFSPDGPRVDLPHPTLLLSGAGRHEKGALEALDLMDELTKACPAHFAIVGPARDPRYWDRVEERIGRSSNAKWYGTVELHDMPQWYRAADIVINTSYTEGLSNALLEALSCGRPVLARDIPGNRSLLAPHHAGLLFRTPTEFVHRALELLSRPDEARALSERARRHAVKHYALAREVDQFLGLYHDVVEGPCRRGAGQ